MFDIFRGIPVILMNYASSVIPVVLVCIFCGKAGNEFLDRCIPQLVKAICRTNAYKFWAVLFWDFWYWDRLQHSQVICGSSDGISL